MASAKWNRKLVANFEADCSGLCKAEMMGITGAPTEYQIRLQGNELQMCLITQPLGLDGFRPKWCVYFKKPV